MCDWVSVFGSYLNSGVYCGQSVSEFGNIEKAAIANGILFVRIDLKKVGNKNAFLKQVAQALNFPPYFGVNWAV